MQQEREFRNVRIGTILKEYGYVTDEQLSQALEYQKGNRGMRLGQALVKLGFISENQLLEALSARLQLEIGELGETPVDLEIVESIPADMAEKYGMLAIAREGDTLTVLINDPLNFYGQEEVRQYTGFNLKLLLCGQNQLDNAISYYYSEIKAKKAAFLANESQRQMPEPMVLNTECEDETPIINLLNSLIERAFHNHASDIHIEPFENHTMIRMRVDGMVLDYVKLQRSLHVSLVARVKILGDMDIAERRLPQDGHFKMMIDQQAVNMRISVMPTVFGEKVVIRLLSSNTEIIRAHTFGMQKDDYEKFKKMLQAPNGLIYLTGPTGSGKTTTLYMVLAELSKRKANISTIEDPVEKHLSRVNQCQVNNQAGMTFEKGLRAILRQDPDIVMVGETRDSETASISVRAAITGHLVLSTLHTNDALSAIVRLEDMGIEPYLVANSLVGMVAQRLIRKLCPDCAKEIVPGKDVEELVGKTISKIKAPVGCTRCNNTGYRGRVAIHEVVYVDQTMRQMITAGSDLEDIRKYVRESQRMRSLKENATKLLEDGITSVEELFKVAY